MPDGDEQAGRERILAEYGRAMLAFQTVEAGLVRCAIPALPEPGEDATVEESWQTVDALYGKTMGHVKNKIEKGVEGVPPELADELEWGLIARNDLAHDFLRDRWSSLGDANTRTRVLRELEKIFERARVLNDAVRDFAEHQMREAGIDPAPGREFARELREQGVGLREIREARPRLAQEFLDSQREPQ